MSTTYSLCCPELELKLWVGQSRAGVNFYVYSDEEQTMESLSKFLIKTQGKNLVFVSDYCEEDWFINCKEYTGE